MGTTTTSARTPVGSHREVQVALGRAMSCSVRVVTVDAPRGAAERALDHIAELESRWSRFLPDSELSQLNAAGGAPVRVAPPTVRLVRALVEAWHVTDGAFDPTLLSPLVGLGYAASRDDGERRTALAASVAPRGRPDRILVDDRSGTVQLPPWTALDAGGLGKGLAADLVVEALVDAGAAGALVEIGGDLRVEGVAPDGDAWPIAVEPVPGGPVELVRLASGGVATSSSRLRTWERDGRVVHHLLDPGTLRSTDGEVVGATAIAGTARWAEVFTKPPFVRGVADGLELMDRHRIAGAVVTSEGHRVSTTSWSEFASTTEAVPS